MPIAPPLAPAPVAAPATPWLATLVHRLAEYGAAAFSRLHAAALADPSPATDIPALTRIARALLWAAALAAVLTGELRLTARPPAPAAAAPQPQPKPRRRRTTARAPGPLPAGFARLSIADIATRICTDLGLTEAAELWPADLMAITQTPAQYSTTHFPPACPPASPQAAPRQQSSPAPPLTPAAAPPPAAPPPTIFPHCHPPPRAPSYRARLLQDTWSLP